MINNISINFPRGKLFFILLFVVILSLITLFFVYQYKPFDASPFFIGISVLSITALLFIYFYPIKNKLTQRKQQKEFKPQNNPIDLNAPTKEISLLHNEIIQALRNQYGTFWHAKVSIQLLLGSIPPSKNSPQV
ncbi:Uncharacterised protein [Providencia rustigianii]|nr:Uncharacterised protein [Providencia rustigianii]